MPNLRKTSQGVKDVVFANPLDITNTFRAVVAVAPKRVGQNTFTNAVLRPSQQVAFLLWMRNVVAQSVMM